MLNLKEVFNMIMKLGVDENLIETATVTDITKEKTKDIIKITRDTQYSIADNCHHKDKKLDHTKGCH